MFKGGALNSWLREFCTLVFTQTIQAFLYGIIISVILLGMTANGNNVSADDNNASLGLMCTFALMSIFKVEEMAKKIFGITESKAGHNNAIRSIAKTAFAVQLGKRVLNNTGKFFGGIGGVVKSGQEKTKLKRRLDEDMADNGFVKGKDGKPVYAGRTKGVAGGSSASVVNSQGYQGYYQKAVQAKANGDMDGYHTNMGIAAGIKKSQIEGGTVGTTGSYDISAADKRRMKNAMRTYEDKLSEINKARNESIKDMFSSVTETIGAAYGAAAGAVIGGADGNIDELFQGMIAGAGVGDIVGKTAIDAADKLTKKANNIRHLQTPTSTRALKKAMSDYNSALSKASVDFGSRIDVEDAND